MVRRKAEGIAMWAFSRRGVKLHRAIVQTLGYRQPQTTRQIGKSIERNRLLKHTSLSTVNKSVRNLHRHRYLTKTQVKERIGGITNYYELTSKAYLAFFMYSNNIREISEYLTGEEETTILAIYMNAYIMAKESKSFS